jgi:hypothetical protein
MYSQIHTHLCIRHGVQTSFYDRKRMFLRERASGWANIASVRENACNRDN